MANENNKGKVTRRESLKLAAAGGGTIVLGSVGCATGPTRAARLHGENAIRHSVAKKLIQSHLVEGKWFRAKRSRSESTRR